MKTTQKIDNQFPRLDADILAAIPSLKDPTGPGAPIIEAAQRLYRFEAEKKAIIGRLAYWSREQSDSQLPLTQAQIQKDADHLMAGGNLDDLVEDVPTDERRTLLRRLAAINRILDDLRHQVHERRAEVVRSVLRDIEPTGREIYEELLGALEHLHEMLCTWDEFCRLLDRRGYDYDQRVGRWSLSDFESALLRGGDFPSVERYIGLRRELWSDKKK